MKRYSSFVAALLPLIAGAQLVVDNTITVDNLVQNYLLGQGVTATNITFNGQPGNQVFAQIAAFDGVNCNVGMANGVVFCSGDATGPIGPNDSGGNTEGGGDVNANDPDLETIISSEVNDASVLEFDFLATGDSIKFNYVFGSDEYLEFVGSFNDVFGFFLSGPGINGPYTNNAINIALIPGTNTPVSINNVNDVSNSQFYVNNGDGYTAPMNTDPSYIQYDGFTVVLTARAAVQCGQTYHIKLAVADAAGGGGFDTVLDSGVLLEEGSFTSTGQVIPHLTTSTVSANDTTMFEGCGVVDFNFIRLGDTSMVDTVALVIGGTATAGIDYSPTIPTQIIYQAGDTMMTLPMTVPLDADGLETLTITITQNVICSGTQVVNTYTFYIDQYPQLAVAPVDVPGSCGQQYVLDPHVSGGTGLYDINWSTGATTPTITVSPGVTTTYYFTVSDTCGISPVSDSIVVTMPVYAPVDITVSPADPIPCLGHDDISVLSAAGGNGVYTYHWTLGGANAGNTATINVPAAVPEVYYVATVTDGCGASDVDSVLVGQAPLDPIHITTMDRQVICQGDTTTLSVMAVTGGNGVYTYQWTNNLNQTLSTADTLQIGVSADAGYVIHVADQCGYEGDTLVHALIPHPAPFKVDLGGDTVICLDDEIELWAHVTGGSGYYSLIWPGYDLTDPRMLVSPPSNEVYSVIAQDQCGEVITDEIHVGVEGPVAEIVATNTGEDDWVFKAATLPTFCRSYRWDLGDGTLSRRAEIAHSYLDLEEHWVHLRVVTPTGCVATDSMLVQPPAHLYFPNAFTPDGDGINELFGPVGHYIDSFEMTIFDRWGQPVYRMDDMQKWWDGKLDGTDAPTGVYVYKYKAEGHLFPETEGYGHITLLRGGEGE